MILYSYCAKEKNGRTVSGTVEAESEAQAVQLLQNRELVVLSVEETKGAGFQVRPAAKDQRVKLDDLVVFVRQLATMIEAGIPLVHSLGILAEQTEEKGLKGIVVAVRRDIEAGMSFSDALAKHPVVFSELFVNMAKAGETSGMLDEILDRLATYLEKQAALSRKIRSSLVYPAVVVIIALIITSILLLKVVPTFKGIFEALESKLPLPTVILIAISDIFKKFFLFLVAILGLFIFLFKQYISNPKGRYKFDQTKLKLIVLGPLFRKLAVAKFARTFSTLVKSGVAVLNALDIVAKTSGNKVIEESVLNCTKAVRDGEPIAKTLSRDQVFPPMVCRMIGVGEQTGQLEKMLSKIADFYDEQVDAAAAALTSLIEPLVIAFLGIVVGGIVIALFLPIFKVTQLISK